MRASWLIAKSVLIEAVRRKEIYTIVSVAVGVILFTGTIHFFGFGNLSKFYREVSLKIMNVATALAVIILAARQLPREFESRTIYPLLAQPIGRFSFLFGKFLGVFLAGCFCYSIFISIFLVGMKYLGATLNWSLFAQAVYFQLLGLGVVASIAFMLSLLLNVDAAITVSVLLFGLGGALTSAIDYIYDSFSRLGVFSVPWFGRELSTSVGGLFIRLLNYSIPQFSLFDMSAKVVHGTTWKPVASWVVWELTLYAAVFMVVFLGLSHQLFRRRAV